VLPEESAFNLKNTDPELDSPISYPSAEESAFFTTYCVPRRSGRIHTDTDISPPGSSAAASGTET
jgi:hypothetical protein